MERVILQPIYRSLLYKKSSSLILKEELEEQVR